MRNAQLSAFVLMWFAVFPICASAQQSTAHISCLGRDVLETDLRFRESVDYATGGRRYFGILSTSGQRGKVRYDFAIELKPSGPVRFGNLEICSISLYTTGSDGEVRAAFFGGHECAVIKQNQTMRLGVQSPKPPQGEFWMIDTCDLKFQRLRGVVSR